MKGPIAEYIAMEGTTQAIKREFSHFLTSFCDEHGESVYGERIRAMCEGMCFLGGVVDIIEGD